MGRGELAGAHVLVTAGPTRAPIDRVRYISNRSSGATGMAVAAALVEAGAAVHVVYGPGCAAPPDGIDLIRVETPEEMRTAALQVVDQHRVTAAVLAAAVLDFVPETLRDEKTPSGGDLVIRFVPTPKIVADLVDAAPEMITVGFKLEVRADDGRLIARARDLIDRHGLSAVLANDLSRITATEHPALLVTADGAVRVNGKQAIARAIVAHLAEAISDSTGA